MKNQYLQSQLMSQAVKRIVRRTVWQNVRRSASMVLAVRLVMLPVMPVTATAESGIDGEKPPLPGASLSVREAIKERDWQPSSLEMVVGESLEEKERREARVRAEAQRQVAARETTVRSTPSGLSAEEAQRLTQLYATKYGVDVNLMKRIISCESGYNQYAKNARSTASGYGQFIAGTWRSTSRALGFDPSVSPFDGDKNLEATAYLMSVRGTSPWRSSASCWAR